MTKLRPAFLPVAPVPDASLDTIESLDYDNVKAGPGRDAKISTVIGKTFDVMLQELSDKIGVSLVSKPGMLAQSVNSPIRGWTENLMRDASILMSGEDRYEHIVELPAEVAENGLAVIVGDDLDGYKIRGLMIGQDFAVQKDWQGMGFGAGLVAASLLYHGGLPAWDHEDPAISMRGELTVLKGMEVAQKLVHEIRAKSEPVGP